MSNLILGGVGFSQLNRRSADKLLGLASELGISSIDTAPSYGNSEEIIGFSKRIKTWQVSTKIGSPNGSKLSKREIVRSVETSLQKLNVESIHTCFIHSMQNEKIDDILIGTLQNLKVSGKIKFLGYSGDGSELDAVVSRYSFDKIMVTLNILDLTNFETIKTFGAQNVYYKRVLCNSVFRINPRLDLIDFFERRRMLEPVNPQSYDFRFHKLFGFRNVFKDYPEIFFSFLLSLGLGGRYLIGTTNFRHLGKIAQIEKESKVWLNSDLDSYLIEWHNLSSKYQWQPLT